MKNRSVGDKICRYRKYFSLYLFLINFGVVMSKQVTRIIKILELFSLGRKLSTTELHSHFHNSCSIRTIQRDLEIIEESGIPIEIIQGEGKEILYGFSRDYRKMVLPSIQKNELIAMYAVKSYLKQFSNISIGKYIQSIIEKLENIAPGEIFIDYESIGELSNNLIINHENGIRDYSIYNDTINKLVSFVINKQWCKITYNSMTDDKIRSYLVYPQRIFSFNSVLYIIVYFPKYKNHLALAIHRIKELILGDSEHEKPIFDIMEFKKRRFGVFIGDIKHVKLLIKPEFAKWFIDRTWHQSAKIETKNNGFLEVEMDVPLSPDFITWLLGWNDGIKVIEPDELIEIIKTKLINTLKQYN